MWLFILGLVIGIFIGLYLGICLGRLVIALYCDQQAINDNLKKYMKNKYKYIFLNR